MPEFVLNRNYTLRSLAGHSVTFAKGIPTFVPPVMVREVISIGAERVDDEQGAGFENEPVVKVDPQGVDRKDAVFKCFATLMAKNGREDFTASGAPHIKAIRTEVGFTVDNKERDKLWEEYRQREAE